MTTEAEILSLHQSKLRQAREKCVILQKNVVETKPRGRHYVELRTACKELEGSCRYMGHKRGDYRWFMLGGVYARAQAIIDRTFVGQKWAQFGEIAKLFERGLTKADDLATKATGIKGTLILPPYMIQ